MISDNYVTGDNIYLRELQNFFFEVLGMMSITHYGAVGDGRTDNYGPIQVAIDDANRRNLNYIYVPYGRFIYTGEFQNMGNIVFIGNPNAHIVNIRTGEEIEIQQFGTTDQTNLRYYVVDRYYTHTDNNFTDEEKAQVAAYALAASTYMVKGTDYVTAGQKSGTTLGSGATAEGDDTTASGVNSHAEGRDTTASNLETHAEGFQSTASGERSHAEGQITTASGHYAHSEGAGTVASGLASHAEGRDTTAAGMFQHVQGINNVVDEQDEYVDIVGAGFNDSPKNISTLDWYGNAWFSGDVYVGSNGGVNKDAGSKKLATEVYVMQQIAQVGSLKIEIVQQLPTHDISTDTIYLLPDPDATQGNAYLEYIYINNAWELIGSTQVDLTNYYTKTEVDNLIPNYTAGANITIDANNEISATDTTYTAGSNINIDANNVISATDTTDYGDLTNKPQINSVELTGNLSAEDLGIVVPNITYSTTDITPGVTPLAEGALYFVYE